MLILNELGFLGILAESDDRRRERHQAKIFCRRRSLDPDCSPRIVSTLSMFYDLALTYMIYTRNTKRPEGHAPM